MSQFKEYARIYFDYLDQYGYIISEKSSVDIVSFVGKSNRIDITFSTVGYELTCHFVNNDNKSFSLQDALEYGSIRKFKGLYQIAVEEEVELGISYLAEAVRILFEKIDVSDSLNFQKIYQFRIDTHKSLLEKYYMEIDLKKAEDYWNKKKYIKAKELFEKHINCLSKVQLKKLEYIKKNMNSST